MSRFLNIESTSTKNLAGGEAFSESPKLELVSILLTSFVEDQFYRKSTSVMQQLRRLISNIEDKKFVAKAAIFSRNEFGMRSISHVAAVELANKVRFKTWTKRFYEKVIFRPDDLLEILALYTKTYGKPIPNALKKGIRNRLQKFNAYQIAKYAKAKAEWSLVDAINLVHPKETDAIRDLILGQLEAAKTWEVGLTQAGQKDGTEKEKEQMKTEVWGKLLLEGKLGYMALLKNLRNILNTKNEGVIELATSALTNFVKIKKSLVLPFRFITAHDEIFKMDHQTAGREKMLTAIRKALDIAVSNIPRLPGKTLVAIDVSGSMVWGVGWNRKSPLYIATLFGGALTKALDSDLLLFDAVGYGKERGYQWLNIDPKNSVMSLQKFIEEHATGGGTDFKLIFKAANTPYDRIIILSDMQGWVGRHAPTRAFEAYKQKCQCDPHVYSIDLSGYGTLMFPEKNVYALSGFSEKIFDICEILEQDREALIHRIEKIKI